MILNKHYLSDISRRNSLDYSADSQRRVFFENRQIYSSKTKYDIFLSHSYLDKNLVYTLVYLFNKSNYSVYVDWMVDTQLDRSQVNKETSEILRMRMDSSKGLAYIATSNTSHSKWCPWELGYEDAKTGSRCAILPVLETTSSIFKGQEYLSLYPYLEYEKIKDSSEYDFWVIDNEHVDYYVKLSNWLNGQNPSSH